jgi:deoxycytidine triphosphate deaminase
MPISGREAVDLGLIRDPDNTYAGLRDASYDLQIGYVVMNGRVYDPGKPEDRREEVPPQQTFTIISREVLEIKKGYLA